MLTLNQYKFFQMDEKCPDCIGIKRQRLRLRLLNNQVHIFFQTI